MTLGTTLKTDHHLGQRGDLNMSGRFSNRIEGAQHPISYPLKFKGISLSLFDSNDQVPFYLE